MRGPLLAVLAELQTNGESMRKLLIKLVVGSVGLSSSALAATTLKCELIQSTNGFVRMQKPVVVSVNDYDSPIASFDGFLVTGEVVWVTPSQSAVSLNVIKQNKFRLSERASSHIVLDSFNHRANVELQIADGSKVSVSCESLKP